MYAFYQTPDSETSLMPIFLQFHMFPTAWSCTTTIGLPKLYMWVLSCLSESDVNSGSPSTICCAQGRTGPGGSLNFFPGRGVRPRFPKCEACELTFASEKGGLWAENFQIWGLVSWKFPNLGACELKFEWKLRLLRLKFPNFLKRGSCELTLLLEMGPLRAAGEAWKWGLQGRTSPYPLSRSVPPPGTGFSNRPWQEC